MGAVKRRAMTLVEVFGGWAQRRRAVAAEGGPFYKGRE